MGKAFRSLLPVISAVALATLVMAGCRKPRSPAPAPSPNPEPAAVPAEVAPAPELAPPPPTPAATAEAPPARSSEPPKDADPVTLQQRFDLEHLNQGLRDFITRNQRLPKDFNELARNVASVPLPLEKKMWVIDANTKTVKAVLPK